MTLALMVAQDGSRRPAIRWNRPSGGGGPGRLPRHAYAGVVKEFAVYTAARLGIFLLSYAVIVGVYLAATGEDQVPLIWPFLVAVVISAVASMTLLRKQRDAFAAAVQERAARSAQRRRLVEEENRRTARGEQGPGRGRTDGGDETDSDEPPASPGRTGR